MTKKELIKYNPTHKMLLELYEDDEEVPNEFVELLYSPPKPEPYMVLMSAELLELWNNTLEEYESKCI